MKVDNLIDRVVAFIFIFFLVWLCYFIVVFIFVFIENYFNFDQTIKWFKDIYDINKFSFFISFILLISEEGRNYTGLVLGGGSLVCWLIISFFFYIFFISEK